MSTMATEDVEIDVRDVEDSSWKWLLRQILVCSGPWTCHLLAGVTFGTPTVTIPQIRKESSSISNSTFVMTDDMASWLSSIIGFAALPWVITMTFFISTIGRKKTFIFLILTSLIGFLLFCFCKDTTQLFISEIILSILQASCTSVTIVTITEYASPKYRGVFLTLKSALYMWGIWIANAIGTFFYWKYIGVFALACNVIWVTILFGKESPSWLASKGRFEECRENHRWLRGTSRSSERELEELIRSQQEYLRSKENSNCNNYITKSIACIRSREFYKPILVAGLLTCMYHYSGKLVCVMYATDIIKKITSDERTAYMTMLALDGITILSAYTGCGLSKKITRRTLLFSTSCVAIIFLYILAIYLYLVQTNILVENNYISITFLTIFSMAISAGVMMLATTMYGEILSLKYRSVSILLVSGMYNINCSTALRISPYVFKNCGLHGGFFFFAIASTIFTWLGYRTIPETKDKTLEEIENLFKGSSRNYEGECLMQKGKYRET